MNGLPKFFFTLQNNIRMYHWQTDSFARHKATDDCLEKLDGLVDKFMEVYQGKYGKIQKGNTQVSITTLTDKSSIEFLKQCIKYLSNITHEEPSIKPSDTDILNLRDELIGTLHQTLYLFTFH